MSQGIAAGASRRRQQVECGDLSPHPGRPLPVSEAGVLCPVTTKP